MESRSPRGTETYSSDVRQYLRYLNGQGLNPDDATVDTVRAYLIEQSEQGLSQRTRRRRIFVLRSFYDWLGHRGDANPARQLKPPKEPQTRGDFYSDAQAQQVLNHIQAQTQKIGKAGLRAEVGYAIAHTLYGTGLRNAELRNLRFDDLDLAARKVRVIGKGDKQRYVPIPNPLVPVLAHYLEHVRTRLPDSDYVFANPRSQPGKWQGRIADKALASLIGGLSEGCGVPGEHHPHRWRHTYATTLLRRGADLHTVRDLLGHASINTTLRYLHLMHDDLQAKVDNAFG